MTPVLMLAALLASADAQARFAGQAALEPPPPVSADRRFELRAALGAGDATRRGGRFEVNARLDPGPGAKSAEALAACATSDNDLFNDSFEGTTP